MLMQLRERVGVVIIPPSNRGDLSDPSLKRILRVLGFEKIVTLDSLERYDFQDGSITALPFSGEHCDLDVHSKHCALVEVKGRRIGLFIDSDAIDIDVYNRLVDRIRNPDIMFIGMECNGAPLSWLYGPLLSATASKKNDNSRRLSGANFAQAWRLTESIQPKRVFVYAMGQEPWMKHVMGLNYTPEAVQMQESNELVRRCVAEGIPAERLYMKMEMEI
jgi:hypothetical protein